MRVGIINSVALDIVTVFVDFTDNSIYSVYCAQSDFWELGNALKCNEQFI